MLASFQLVGTSMDSRDQKSLRDFVMMLTNHLEDSQMNLIRPHRLVGIQLEQILHKFRVNWRLISLTVMVLQIRAPTLPWPIFCVIPILGYR